MARLRSEIWVSGFVRRHDSVGRICVVSRRGDPAAGQIWVEVDHLNGTVSLFVPAPAVAAGDDGDRLFACRFDREAPQTVRERIRREAEFDPDLWVVTLEARDGDYGIALADASGG
jgi:hypothetical protein